MDDEKRFVDLFHAFYSSLKHLQALELSGADDLSQSTLEDAQATYSQLQDAMDNYAQELENQKKRLDASGKMAGRRKKAGFTHEQLQKRLASFRSFAQQQQWEIISHEPERNKVLPFTIVSETSVILIKLSPFGGVVFCGEQGAALQTLLDWVKQEHPSYRDYSGYPSLYPIVKQFQQLSLPLKRL